MRNKLTKLHHLLDSETLKYFSPYVTQNLAHHMCHKIFLTIYVCHKICLTICVTKSVSPYMSQNLSHHMCHKSLTICVTRAPFPPSLAAVVLSFGHGWLNSQVLGLLLCRQVPSVQESQPPNLSSSEQLGSLPSVESGAPMWPEG